MLTQHSAAVLPASPPLSPLLQRHHAQGKGWQKRVVARPRDVIGNIHNHYPRELSTVCTKCSLPHPRSRYIFGLHRVLTLGDTLNPSLPLTRTRICSQNQGPRDDKSHPGRTLISCASQARQHVHQPNEMGDARCNTTALSSHLIRQNARHPNYRFVSS